MAPVCVFSLSAAAAQAWTGRYMKMTRFVLAAAVVAVAA